MGLAGCGLPGRVTGGIVGKQRLTPAAEYARWLGTEIVDVDLRMLAGSIANMMTAMDAADEALIMAVELPDGLPFLAKFKTHPGEISWATAPGYGLVENWLTVYQDVRARFAHFQDLLRTKRSIDDGCQQLATISHAIEDWLFSGLPGPDRAM